MTSISVHLGDPRQSRTPPRAGSDWLPARQATRRHEPPPHIVFPAAVARLPAVVGSPRPLVRRRRTATSHADRRDRKQTRLTMQIIARARVDISPRDHNPSSRGRREEWPSSHLPAVGIVVVVGVVVGVPFRYIRSYVRSGREVARVLLAAFVCVSRCCNRLAPISPLGWESRQISSGRRPVARPELETGDSK